VVPIDRAVTTITVGCRCDDGSPRFVQPVSMHSRAPTAADHASHVRLT